MCELENGRIKTSLPDETIENILVQEFKGLLSDNRKRGLLYIIPIDAQLTPEQVAAVPNSRVLNPNGRMIERKHFQGAEYRPAVWVGKTSWCPDWTVDGDSSIAIFFDGKYAYTSTVSYCHPTEKRGFLMTASQASALENFLAQFTEKVREAEARLNPSPSF